MTISARSVQWTLALAIAAYAVHRRSRDPNPVRVNVLGTEYAGRLPAWWVSGSGAYPMMILGDRRPKPDKIGIFRRILTVTNMMCLAGNKVEPDDGVGKDKPTRSRLRKRLG